MAKGPEALFRDNIVIPYLRSLPECFHFIKEAAALRGIPDIIGCYKGRFFGIELKKDKYSCGTTKGRIVLQKMKIKWIEEAGGIAFFTCPENWEEDKLKLDPTEGDFFSGETIRNVAREVNKIRIQETKEEGSNW